jgi:hypothetical protein
MAINYGWMNLRRTASILRISVKELIDGMFEGWAPYHEFYSNGTKVRFRMTDVWFWLLVNGHGGRTSKLELLYGSK